MEPIFNKKQIKEVQEELDKTKKELAAMTDKQLSTERDFHTVQLALRARIETNAESQPLQRR